MALTSKLKQNIAMLTLSSALLLTGLTVPPGATAVSGTLTNGSFETYTDTDGVADGWTSYAPQAATTDLQVVNSPVHQGTSAQKVSASGIPAGEYVNVHQVVAVDPGAQYVVSGMFNIESLTNANAELYVDFYDPAGNRIDGASTVQSAPSNGYIKLDNVRVTPDNAASMRVYALLRATADGGAGTFCVDNLTIRKTASALDNGSFETYTGTNGVADSWLMTVAPNATADLAVVDSPVSTGTHSQKVSGSGLAAGEAIHINQTVASEPNTAYTVTGKFNIAALDNAKAQLYLDYYDTDGNWLKAYPVEYTQTTSGYIELKNAAITPAATGYFRVYAVLRGTADGASGTFYVDDIKVSKTRPAGTTILYPKFGRASASTNTDLAILAFDNDSTTYWKPDYDSAKNKHWLEYDFGTPVIAVGQVIVSLQSNGSPESWELQAYNGNRWITLQSAAGPWVPGANGRNFSNSTGYNRYRLYFPDYLTNTITEFMLSGVYAIPSAPANVTATQVTSNSVTLNWKPLDGVTGYNVYQDGVKINLASITDTQYVLSNLTPGRTYTYQVTAFNNAGESVRSQSVVVTANSL